jgi:hypothetical protein
MEKPDLRSLWQKGQQKIIADQNLSKMEIEAYIKPRVKKSSLGVKLNLSFYTIMAFASLLILMINSIFFITNPIIHLINIIGIFISGYFVYYGWYSFRQLKSTESGIRDLSTELRKKIDFYSHIYERWIWFVPTVTLLLIFAVTTLVDHEDGTYRINKPFLIIGINLFIFVGLYLLYKVSHQYWLKDIKDYLNDVDHQLLEGSLEIETRKKKFAWLIVLIVILLSAFLIWGIFMTL